MLIQQKQFKEMNLDEMNLIDNKLSVEQIQKLKNVRKMNLILQNV